MNPRFVVLIKLEVSSEVSVLDNRDSKQSSQAHKSLNSFLTSSSYLVHLSSNTSATNSNSISCCFWDLLIFL